VPPRRQHRPTEETCIVIAPGTSIGRYRVEQLLGVGGMGEVYLARDRELDRLVALKVLPRELAGVAGRRERLELEARSASALNHPNILTVYDLGEEGGVFYLATEFVPGTTLRQRLDAVGGRLGLGELLPIGLQLAAALAAAASAGLVHRDLKPENVMLRPDGWVKVLDFGLARPAGSTPRRLASGEPLTRPHVLLGTLAYMAPEQIREQPLDARTDQWSFGVVLYEAVSGYLPFAGFSPADVLAAILHKEPPRLADLLRTAVPEGLQQLVSRCLAKDPDARFPTPAALLAALRALAREVALADDPVPLPLGAVPAGVASRRTSSAEGVLAGADTALLAAGDLTALARNNLPAELRPFVGRREELGTATEWLANRRVRLLTVTGPGGVGKTRFALQLAALAGAGFVDGVTYVPLANARRSADVATAILAALEQPEIEGSDPWPLLAGALRGRRALLVLDNLEQVTDLATDLAALLRAAGTLVVIATSRSALRIGGEQELALEPLPVPAGERAEDPAELAASPAVALFVDRARAVRPGFRLGRDNAAAVGAICRRLDGLPLALELAASRLRLLSPAALAARLERSLEVLTDGERDLPARQRTLRDALAWSYQLLDEREQALFRQLAIFAGPFDAGDVAAVVRFPERPALALLDPLVGLAALVEANLLRMVADAGAEEPRFAMLATLRELGQEYLSAAGELLDTAERHALHQLAEAERAAAALDEGGPVGAVLLRLVRRHDDLRAALDWALASGEPSAGVRLAAASWWLWYLHGHYAEGRRRLAAVLAAAEGGSLDAAAAARLPRVLVAQGTLAFLQCDYAEAERWLERGLGLARERGDERSHASALQTLGSMARERGDHELARRHHAEARERFLASGDWRGVARSDNYLAFLAWLGGDPGAARQLAAQAEATFASLGDSEGRIWAGLNRVAADLVAGELEEAAMGAEAVLAAAAESGFREGIAWALNLSGEARRRRGEPAAARPRLVESLALHHRLGDRWRLASLLEALAATDLALGAPAAAARFMGAARGLRARAGVPIPPVEVAAVEATRDGLLAALGAEALGRELAAGRAAALEALVAEAEAAPEA
jgi:predicted ATPase